MLVINREETGSANGRADARSGGPSCRVTRNVSSMYFRLKAVLEYSLAALLLIPALPLIGLLVVAVRLTSRGPGIFRQRRVGKNGKNFDIYKLRTMTWDAELDSGPVWTTKADGRITRLGAVLRKLHLDEFPQLFNVLKGEMALIGPRPERPEFVHVLAKKIPGYLNRTTIRPGITGLAQINLEPDTDLQSVRCKLVLDVEYIETAGFLMDLRIFLCTFLRLLGLNGVHAMRVMGLHRVVSGSDRVSPMLDGPNPSIASIVARSNGSGNGHALGNGHAAANGHAQPKGESCRVTTSFENKPR